MLSTHCNTHFAVINFKIVSIWKLPFTKLTLSDRLTGLLRLISIVHLTIKHLFSLAQDQNLLARANGIWFFSCLKKSNWSTKYIYWEYTCITTQSLESKRTINYCTVFGGYWFWFCILMYSWWDQYLTKSCHCKILSVLSRL